MFKAVLLPILFLSACGGELKTEDADTVSVFVSSSAVQCADTGLPISETEAMLLDQGVVVLNSSCGHRTELSYNEVCGGEYSNINIHTIRYDDIAIAESIGFERVEGLAVSAADSGEGYVVTECPAADSSSDDIRKFTFSPYKKLCVGVGQRTCLVETSEGFEQLFYDKISGFDYEWGRTYTLYATITDIENPLADASSRQYELVMITSEIPDPEGTVYEYTDVELLESIITKESGEYYFLGDVFACAEGINCDELLALNNSGDFVDITFEYQGQGEIALVDWNET